MIVHTTLNSCGVLAFVALLAASTPFAAQDSKPAEHRPLPSAEELSKLPKDGGPDFNRLVFEGSPYLLQHATNPVDWFPWGAEGFAKARAEDKPIFLSIGYSTCHWCHVMEHESFEDADVAALLNASFVAIKVDREERPDIDEVYMTFCQAITGAGGWPMTIVMTPEQKPFFAGTYFPKRALQGRSGMLDLLPRIVEAWTKDRSRLLADAEHVTSSIRASLEAGASSEAKKIDPQSIDRAAHELAARFDAHEGGFGSAPKFPMAHELRLLLRRDLRRRASIAGDDLHALAMVETTLRALARGGIHDQIGSGFHRYSTDRRWLVPHFEKMLYDQATLAQAYVEAFELTRNREYETVARDIFDYVLRDARTAQGGFRSAVDADSAGAEGLFYTWTPSELVAVLGDDDGAFAADIFGVTLAGQVRDGASAIGRSVLHLEQPLSLIAAQKNIDSEELRARLASVRARLFAARELRVPPRIDDKILTDWNGLMIAALCKGARAFDEPKYARAALECADFVLDHLRDDKGRLLKRYRDGEAALPALLDDYAFLIAGLIELYETDFDPRWLERAIGFCTTMLEKFWDEKSGGFFTTASDGEALLLRVKSAEDGAIPSGNSVAALDLLRIARLTGDNAYEARAEELLRAFAKDIERAPSAFSEMLIAHDFATGPSFEIVIAGRLDADDTRAMLRALRERFLPNAVIVFRPDGGPEGESEPPIARLAPYTRDQKCLGGKATAYVCRDFACAAPTNDPGKMIELLEGRAAQPLPSPK